VTARANPGSLIELDQCQQCGGIWCDKWELFPIQAGEAERLEPVNQELLSSPPARRKKRKLYCPRCTAPLAKPHDPLFGPEIQFERCLKCDGIWLKRGQLTTYKRRQQKIREEKMGAEAMVGRLAEYYNDPKQWVVTGTQGMFAYPRGVEEGSETVEKTLGGAFRIVLQTLVRMALGI
jgi:Zn-finger nucleic acid-binding protein